MRHGFKAQAERLSLELRAEQSLTASCKLLPRVFLASIGITIWEPKEIPGIDHAHVIQLTETDPDSWSGCTIKENGHTAIIINPTHPITRQANTLMHEWSHIKLRHKPNRVDRSPNGLLLLSDYPKDIEDEADWLAGALLLPREGILQSRKQGLTAERIAQHYGVSKDLTNWRLRMTGVNKQVSASRRY